MIFHDNILLIHWTCIKIYMKKNKYNLEMLTKFKSQNYKIIKNKVKCKFYISQLNFMHILHYNLVIV